MGELFSDKSFYLSLLGSFRRIALSFGAALLFGVAFALIAARSTVFKRLFYPLVIIVRATPTMSVIFLCIIWFRSELSPMIVAFTVLFPQLYASVLSAVEGVDGEIKELARVYKVPMRTQLLDFYLPSVAARVYSDSVSAAALNVKLIIAAEALAQTKLSLGQGMQLAKAWLETGTLMAYTVIAVALSYAVELIMRLIRLIARRVSRVRA